MAPIKQVAAEIDEILLQFAPVKLLLIGIRLRGWIG